jgi:hypothetical protein
MDEGFFSKFVKFVKSLILFVLSKARRIFKLSLHFRILLDPREVRGGISLKTFRELKERQYFVLFPH